MQCSQCGSEKLFKDGKRYLADGGAVQRFLCRSCGYRFSERSCRKLQDSINIGTDYNSNNQVCVLAEESKNLVSAQKTKISADNKRLKPLPQETRGLIVKFSAYLEREGYYENSSYRNLLIRLANLNADLHDPEDVKTKIAQAEWKDSVKMLATYAYDLFCKMEGRTWNRPRYKQQETMLYVPDEKDLDQLISATQSRQMAAFLQGLKETFCDPSELLRLEWREIKGNVISIAHPVKGHLTGQIEVSGRLIAMLNALPRDSKLVFPTTYKNIAETYRIIRKRAAQKLANPNLLEISFKSYRHWGGSMLAHLTNGNILTIKKLLRHKRIENTMKYIHTIQFRDEDYEISTATTEEEIKQLGKAGFIKYDEMSGIHFYRKPKRFGV